MAGHGGLSARWAELRAILQYYFPALIVIAAVAVSIVYADTQKKLVHLDNTRNQVAEQLGALRTNLETNINSNVQLIRGFVAALETEPSMDRERFSALAARIFDTTTQLRSLAAAPDMRVSYVYPTIGNEGVMGLDYRTNEIQRKGAERARDTGRYVITGPLDLVQGGRGVIVRYPVVYETRKAGRNFWGILSAVIDIERLYEESGLKNPDLPIDIAISTELEDGRLGNTFFGNATIETERPVRMTVSIGELRWRVSAVPKGGWTDSAPDMWLFRALMLTVGVLIMAPVLWVASLLRERHGNITVLRQREEELRALSHRLEIALEASKIGVWELDIASGELNWDARMRSLYGVENATVAEYATWRNILHPDDVEEAERQFAESVASGRDYSTEFRVICPSGEIRHIRSYGTMYRDSRFRKKMVGINWNVTGDVKLQQALIEAKRQAEIQNQELERARQHMEYNSLHDALTDLPNRRFLDQRLKEMDETPGVKGRYALLHIDLDRFKEINDTLGHGAGDVILRHAAARLRENIRRGDFAARIGGDEFVVVCAGTATESDYTELAKRLIDAINASVTYHGHDCRVGASIGIAVKRGPEERADQLLVNADIALYDAKRRGRNRVEHYTEAMKSLAVATKQTADAILKSVEQNGFIAYYQPQFDASTLAICGVEALARWDHPERGLLGPATFLAAAEDLNVVSQIDAAILDQTLFQATRWEANGLVIPKVSVNISAQRLFDEGLLEHLERINIPKGRVSFELLESISFDDKNEAAIVAIERIRQHGIDIEIDDFGTGYASILSLLKLSPRRLKIDRQLTRPVIESEAQRRLIGSIVEIGRSLSIDIVAEGVETMEHATILRELGCQTLQGYALARPMSANDFMEFALDYQKTMKPPIKSVG
ncbi:EAL domain-containing protein [Ciceribacter sp. L1K22]|uniref:bifunctional diguanylate cyclase/phosphodiesterase n=1 Tax=Ciceribacter sp. L1K22 TaxID=2820275 RepID=UPI001ABE5055|nr:EAL domain-containing protein [Ciceribacter sp. L1K22]MBO3761236.1 EAL domain-containing protein [Ciceribacter sp. L1K22]